MAVAFDAFNSGAAGTGNLSWTHTPVGTPRAVIVTIGQGGGGSNVDEVTSVTYGGVAMTEISGSPQLHEDAGGTDDGANYVYFLGSNIPTGAQTVEVTVSGAHVKRATSTTLTASADTEVIDADSSLNGALGTNPSVTLQLNGRASFAAIKFFSYHGDPVNISPLSGWTSRNESDFGGSTGGTYTYDTIGTADVTAGWTSSATSGAGLAFAVSEVQVTDRRVHTTWAEFEAPFASRKAIATWAEFELPEVTARGVRATWAEIQVPDFLARRVVSTWSVLEIPDAPRRVLATWAEMEFPLASRWATMTWAEMESPFGPRKANVTWAELNILDPLAARVFWAELETPRVFVPFPQLPPPPNLPVMDPLDPHTQAVENLWDYLNILRRAVEKAFEPRVE